MGGKCTSTYVHIVCLRQAAHREKDCKSVNKNGTKKRVICCPVSGSSLGSAVVVEGKGHKVASSDVVHMQNFNVVNNCEQGVNVSTAPSNLGNPFHVNNNTDHSDRGVKYVT